MRKNISIVLIIVILGFVGRVIYVNSTYPYAGIKTIKNGEAFEGEVFDIYVKGIESYKKETWGEYIESHNIVKEEQINNVAYIGNADKVTEKVDYWISYNPDDEYTVVVVNVEIVNKADKKCTFSTDAGLNLISALNDGAEICNNYYSAKLSDVEFSKSTFMIDILSGQKKKVNLVYICANGGEEYILEKLELGNNQRMKVKVENK